MTSSNASCTNRPSASSSTTQRASTSDKAMPPRPKKTEKPKRPKKRPDIKFFGAAYLPMGFGKPPRSDHMYWLTQYCSPRNPFEIAKGCSCGSSHMNWVAGLAGKKRHPCKPHPDTPAVLPGHYSIAGAQWSPARNRPTSGTTAYQHRRNASSLGAHTLKRRYCSTSRSKSIGTKRRKNGDSRT